MDQGATRGLRSVSLADISVVRKCGHRLEQGDLGDSEPQVDSS